MEGENKMSVEEFVKNLYSVIYVAKAKRDDFAVTNKAVDLLIRAVEDFINESGIDVNMDYDEISHRIFALELGLSIIDDDRPVNWGVYL